jgi:hypothetical protein
VGVFAWVGWDLAAHAELWGHRGKDRTHTFVIVTRGEAVVSTAVVVVVVAIVTLFALLYFAVSTCGQPTLVCTFISVVQVTIITGLYPLLLETVTAHCQGAVHAGVRVDVIAIVTHLWLAILIDGDDTIAAARRGAVAVAFIAVLLVAVVALFDNLILIY